MKSKDKLLALLLYFVFVLLITFPLALHLRDSYHFFLYSTPPQGEQFSIEKETLTNDTLVDIWMHWLFRKSLLSGKLPLSTDLIYGVDNAPIAASVNNWISPLLTFLTYPFLGLIGSFNLQTLLILTLNGFSVYVFVNWFIKSRTASFLSGIFIISSSYVYLRSLDQIGLSAVFPLVFFLLFFIRAAVEINYGKFIVSGLFLFLAGLFSWYFLFYGILVSFFIILYFIVAKRIDCHYIAKGYAVYLISVFIFISPFALLLIKSLERGFLRVTYVDSVNYSADIFSLILPNPESSLWGNLTKTFYKMILFRFTSPIEKETAFLGYLGIPAIFYYAFKVKDKLKPVLFLVFFSGVVLSLGPYLTVMGRVLFPLPYSLLSIFFPFLQSPNRFIVFALIAESLFLGYLVRDILARFNKTGVKWLVFALLGLYLSVENISWPYHLALFSFDNPFYKSLRATKNQKMVLNLPVSHQAGLGNAYYLSQQVLFNQRMINGYSASLALPFVRLTPYFSPVLYPLVCLSSDKPNKEFGEDFKSFLKDNKVNYVIVQKRILRFTECAAAVGSIDVLRKTGVLVNKVFEDDNIAAFTVD